MRRQEVTQPPFPLFVAAMLLAIGLVAFLLFALRRDSAQPDETSGDRTFRSALLPDDWTTYGGDYWSVGIPDDWSVRVGDDIVIGPSNRSVVQQRDYFAVASPQATNEEVHAMYQARGDVTQTSEFLFAGYETVKYDISSGGVFYVINYKDEQTYIVSTLHNDDPEIGIMLATFQFLY